MHIVVAGATGATGRLVVDQAIATGHHVTALVRDPAGYDPPPGVAVQEAQVVTDGDLTLPVGTDAVITTLGKRSSRDSEPVCAAGTANLITAMRRSDIRRIVAVSASPVLTSGVGEPWWFRYGLRPFVRRLGSGLYTDLEAMEDTLRGTDRWCEWTLVRPGYLTDTEPTDYQLISEANATTSACRADLADALIALSTDASAVGRSYGLKRGRLPRRVPKENVA